MHFATAKSILSAKGTIGANGMNIYRGCTHGCIYCDSRSACYHIEHDFEDVEVKENALELLDDRLMRKRSKCMIGTGSMSDPYMHAEQKLLYTRQALEIAARHGYGFTLVTKSDLVLRDLDLISAINRKSKCVIQMSLTVADDALSKIVEPRVSPTSDRFEALKKLNEAGVPTVVWMTPILPFITDTEENVRSLLDMCVEAKVHGIICFGMGMTLREGSREYYYAALDRHFPGLRQRYEQTYGDEYHILSPDNDHLMRIFHETCAEHGILDDPDTVFQYLNEFPHPDQSEQMSLF